MGINKTHEQYVEEVRIVNPNIEVLGFYVKAKIKILHRCIKHDYIWETTPSRILMGAGCKYCLKEKISSKVSKTNDEYIKELKDKNPKIEVVEEYIDATTPIIHKCKIHNYEFKVSPSGALNRNGCPKCNKKYRMTHEEYVNELMIKNPNLEVVGTFINMNTKILHRCKTHNIIWEKSPYNALKGGGCKQCSNDILSKTLTKSHEDYVSELNDVNPNIEVVGLYKTSLTKILHRCKLDGYEWYAQPSNLLNRTGCPKCNGGCRRTLDEFISDLNIASPNTEYLNGYINITTKANFKCRVCNHEWSTLPEVVLRGCGCPKCGDKKIGEKLVKSHDEYVEELSIVNSDIEVIDKYINASTPIRHRCKVDGTIWSASPSHLLGYTGCPVCSSSKGELQVKSWLDNKGVSYEYQKRFDDCKMKNTLPFDFYLPNHNICIEYDGKQHYEPIEYFGGEEEFKSTQIRDQIKTNYCNNNGIMLIRIPYYENVKEKLDLLLT